MPNPMIFPEDVMYQGTAYLKGEVVPEFLVPAIAGYYVDDKVDAAVDVAVDDISTPVDVIAEFSSEDPTEPDLTAPIKPRRSRVVETVDVIADSLQ